MTIKLTKLKELPDAKHPGNIPEGDVKILTIDDELFREPTVGESFWPAKHYNTSKVVEIISMKIFKTMNSIYQWEKISNINTTQNLINEEFQS